MSKNKTSKKVLSPTENSSITSAAKTFVLNSSASVQYIDAVNSTISIIASVIDQKIEKESKASTN